MAEYTNAAAVDVAAGQNVPLTETAVSGSRSITHRAGAGVVTLRGLTAQCCARYKVSFGANIAIADGGTVEAISAALAVEGEPLASATAIVTPAAAGDFWNIFTAVVVSVPAGCCVTVAAENTSAQTVTFQNSNLIVERIS